MTLTADATNGTYVFARCRYDVSDRSLTVDGTRVRLTPKAEGLLLAFLESSGRLLTKAELLERVWPGTFVEPGTLTFHIHQLRQALGDTAVAPKYIATVSGRGYRLVCQVTWEVPQPDSPPSAVSEPTPARPPQLWRRRSAAAAALILALLTVAMAIDARDHPMPTVAMVTYLTHDGRAKTDLTMPDASRLAFRIENERFELRLADNRVIRRPELDEYHVLDFSTTRGEFLARRPNDRGAESALWAVRTDGSARRRIGMVKGAELAAWSRDGGRIAYSSDRTIYTTDAEGGGWRTVASFTGIPHRMRWSPGDEFLRVDVAFLSDRTATVATYDVTFDGKEPKRLVDVPPARVVCCGLWLPNSDDYLFVAGDRTYDVWILRGSRGRLWPRPPLLSRLTSPSNDTSYDFPIAAKDGPQVYAVAYHREGLTTYDPARRAFVPYLGGLEATGVQPSPDGKWLTYIDRSNQTLWRARADGSNRQQLTPAAWQVGASAWKPDGGEIAILAFAPNRPVRKVYVLPAGGGLPRAIDWTDVEQGVPSWSADGTRLAFGDVPERYGQPSGTERIHVFDLRTGMVTDISGSTGLWSSRWSPDGNHIAATRISDRMLFLYDIAAKQWRSLGIPHVGELRWSRDGAYIYCEPERPEVWLKRIRVADGHVEHLIDTSGQDIEFGAGMTPDGRPLFHRALEDVVALRVERR